MLAGTGIFGVSSVLPARRCVLTGAEVRSLELPAKWNPTREPMTLQGLVFDRHGVRPKGERAPPDRVRGTLSIYELQSGRLYLCHVFGQPLLIRFEGKEGAWRGCLPYVTRSDVVEIAETQGKVFFGSDAGYVECIDLTSSCPYSVIVSLESLPGIVDGT